MIEESGATAQFEPPRNYPYFEVLRRRKAIVALAVVAVTLLSLGLSLRQTKTYQASAEVLFASESDDSKGEIDAETEIRVVESQSVRAIAAKQVPDLGTITVSQRGESKVLAVASESSSAEQAAASVNGYVDAYIQYKRQKSIDELEASAQRAEANIADLQKQVDAVNADLASARTVSPTVAEGINLRRNSLVSQQTELQEKLRDVRGGISAAPSRGPQVLSQASPPEAPVSPKPVNAGLMGIGLGLLLGGGLAFLFEYLDDSVKSPDDVERAAGLPVLATVPTVPSWKDAAEAMVVSVRDRRSASSEAYRSLRTAVQFLSLDRPIGNLLVTSPSSREGKSTTVANLAVAMARAGTPTIVIDCDLRIPRLHEFFGLDNDIGLTTVMADEASVSSALRPVPRVDGLMVMTSGPIPLSPSELLSSPRFAEILFELKEMDGARLIIDSPPLLPVTDSSVLSASVDATLLVTTVGLSTKKRIRRAIELLARLDTPIVGTVLNQLALDNEDYAYYDVTKKGRGRKARSESQKRGSQKRGSQDKGRGSQDKGRGSEHKKRRSEHKKRRSDTRAKPATAPASKDVPVEETIGLT